MDDGIPSDRRADLWVGGTSRPPSTAEYRPVLDPSTGAPLGEVAVGSSDDARAAVEAAEATRATWGETPGHRRAAILLALSTRLRDDRETMARLIAREVGKPVADARVEVERAATVFAYAAEEIRHLTGETFPADAYAHPAGNEGRLLFTVRDPVGVVVAIGPFNFPLNLLSHKVAPALAAGNPVVAKPTSAAPFTALRLAQHAASAGVPAGVFNVVLGPGGAVGNALVEHPATRLVTFTGSTEVGKGIAERAGRHAKRVILELGGVDPFVV
ncbi:MAG: aldehyde dehydrogenase family protein, partial [Thermoplasmata archaeon]|nr:aldehyde dehydrogenase family protein [Thermoplasmata archaeon]